jgi:predicted metal-dependent hydrolase
MDRRTARALLGSLTRDADRICEHFSLRYRSIEAERANVKLRYGICYSDGSIKIRLRHATTGEPLKYSSLVNTLCHELAHLEHFNHGPRFQDFYARILAWARRQQIYRPREAGPRPSIPLPTDRPSEPVLRAPVQLSLF